MTTTVRLLQVLMMGLFVLATTAAGAREVRVGIYENPPKLMVGGDGRADGIFGNLLTEIAHRESWTLRGVPCRWEACLEALHRGELDLLPDVARTEERERLLAFHAKPVMHSWSDLYVPSAERVHSILDFRGKRIAVLAESVQEDYLRQLFAGFGIEVSLVPVSSFDDGLARVAQGQADAAAVNHNYGELNARRYHLVSSAVMFQPAELFFATSRGANADLLAAIDHHLATWQADQGSFYFKVMERWMAQPPATGGSVWWAWVAGGVSIVALIVLLINLMLRRKVRAQTARLEEDLVRLREADEALGRQRDFFLSLIRTIPDPVWLKNPDGVYLACNPRFESFFGAKEGDIVGKTDYDFVDRDLADFFRAHDRAAMAASKPSVNEEWLTFAADGYRGLFETTKTPMFDANGRIIGVLGIAHDITERKRIESQIEHLAYHDQLTGLPNRSLLLARLRQELAASRRHSRFGAVMFVDLDQFKQINDVHGHTAGDEVLKEVATRLRYFLRQEDTVARFGGDEFVIVLAELSADQETAGSLAFSVAEKIRVALERPVRISGQDHLTTASIGVSLFPKQDEDVDDLIREADIAMYRAKDRGRNAFIFFEEKMQAQIADHYALERELRDAVTHGALELFLQSQFTAEEKVVGAEALVRWHHPTRGLVSPATFIPLAEKSGQIVAIGEWVLREACRLLVQLHEAGHALRLSVNVSPRQFHEANFVSRVKNILVEAGADPLYLTLEITESLLVEKTEEAVSRMLALSELGIRFAIDDFGTGYSSLSYLKRLPLNQLKIDKSFVHDVPDDPNDVALVETILSVARHLHFDVVAEGVETREQLEFLSAQGCSCFQGYFFHRPQPSREWLAQLNDAAA